MAKVKGSAMIDVVKFLRTRRDEAAADLPGELLHYLDEKILASSWYPESDLIGLLRTMAKFFPGQAGADIYEVIGTVTANKHLTGIYEHMLKEANVSDLPLRLSTLWGTQHDTGRLSLERQGPRHMRMEIADYGHPTEEMCKILSAYAREAYRTVGVSNPQVTKASCCLRGDPVCSWQITWTESDGPDG